MPSDELPREPAAADRKPTGQSPEASREALVTPEEASAGAEDLQDS